MAYQDLKTSNTHNLSSEQQRKQLEERLAFLKSRNTALYTAASNMTDAECYAEIVSACKEYLRTNSEDDERKLAAVLEKHNLQLYHYPPASETQGRRPDNMTETQNAVARMAFDGVLPDRRFLMGNYKIRDQEISKNIIMGNGSYKGKVKPEDYDFKGSVWEVFKKIPEFAALEDKLREGLAAKGISPHELGKLHRDHICYVLDEQLRRYPGEKRVRFMKESQKARNTKRFIAEYEQEFRAGLANLPGIRKDYIDALVETMKSGYTDVSKYRDKNGQRIWKEEWADQPVINVHHVINVKDSRVLAEEGKDWTHVNDFENMCFIVTHPEHDAMHALEAAKKEKDGTYRECADNPKDFHRIQPPAGVRCMLGFHNMIYDHEYVRQSEKTKAEIKDRYDKHPNRVSGSHGRSSYVNVKKDTLKSRHEWRSRERNDARYGND